MTSDPSLTTLDVNLDERRILVLEDEYFIADDIAGALHRFGAEVVGPVPDVGAARALSSTAYDCAVLDINLKGEMVFDFADELLARGTPFVFATGYDAPVVPDRLAHVIRCEKPLNLSALVQAVARVVGSGPA